MPGTKLPGSKAACSTSAKWLSGSAVQHQPADCLERVVPVGPDLCQVEGVEAVVGGLPFGHDLHLHGPGGELAGADGVVQVLVQVGGVLAAQALGLLGGEAANALVGLEVELDPEALAGGVDPLIGVRAEAVHVAEGGGDAPVAEQPGELMGGLGRVGEEVPDVVRLLPVGEGVGLLRVDEVGELDAVADEEHRRVVPHQVPVALLAVDLEGEAARIAGGVGGAPRARHRGEAQEGGGPLADLGEQGHLGPAGRRRGW